MNVGFKNLPIDLLRTFVTVTDFNNISRAGDVLGRSQPAISLQIKRLESLINESLFQRTQGWHQSATQVSQ